MEREIFLSFLAKKLSGELNPAESAELAAAIETVEEYRAIHDAVLLPSYCGQVNTDPVMSLEKVWKKIEAGTTNRTAAAVRQLPRSLWIAAGVVLIFGIYWIFSNQDPTRTEEADVMVRSSTHPIDTLLQDGTRIILHEQSELSIAPGYGTTSRSLVLKGNAFFDVAENPDLPMVVQSGPVDIVVKGTAFSVAGNDQGKVRVELLRGRVEVRNHEDSSQKRVLLPGESVSVAPNAQHALQFEMGKLPDRSPLITLFGADTLRFQNQRFDSLVLLLQKKYGVRIEIGNEALKSKRFSGMFVTETLQEALSALQFTYSFSYITVDQKTIIQ